MTASTSLSTFHQWLLTDPATLESACAIVLHVDPAIEGGSIVEEIAEYLNEYDDDGDGSWLPATHALVARVAADGNYRRLLGIPEIETSDPEDLVQALKALGKRGRVVLEAPEAPEVDLELGRAFHAGVGVPCGDSKRCHLFLNTDLIERKSLANIIGDVFLEWLHCGNRRPSALHELE